MRWRRGKEGIEGASVFLALFNRVQPDASVKNSNAMRSTQFVVVASQRVVAPTTSVCPAVWRKTSTTSWRHSFKV